jgi:hypothetical protein
MSTRPVPWRGPNVPNERKDLPGALIRAGALALALATGLSACGDDDKESKKGGGAAKAGGNEIAFTVSETGKTAKITAPKTAEGGVANLKLTNSGKAPHEAQLLRIEGDQTPQDVFKAVQDDTAKNEWLRAEGGVGQTPPGATATATVQLKAGRYMVADLSNEEGQPAYAEFKVTGGGEGSLPSTDTTVTAAEVGDDKYKWELSSPLKSGGSTITFKSEGKEALHFVGAARLTKEVSKKEVVKSFDEEGPPPPFIDEKSFTSTAILDGGKSQVAQFNLSKPGKWVLFCPLPDRGENKSHTQQGLVEIIDVE